MLKKEKKKREEEERRRSIFLLSATELDIFGPFFDPPVSTPPGIVQKI